MSDLYEELIKIFDDVSKIEGFDKQASEEFIEVGEPELALDEMSYPYIKNGLRPSSEIMSIFRDCYRKMEMVPGDRWKGVAQLLGLN
jgi:hypothetical protein